MLCKVGEWLFVLSSSVPLFLLCHLLLPLSYLLQSSWSSSWPIWWREGPRSVSRCPTGCASLAPSSALLLQASRWGLPGHTGWTTILSGCAGCCSFPQYGCRLSRKDCSRRCPHLRHWTEPCPGSAPAHSREMHHLCKIHIQKCTWYLCEQISLFWICIVWQEKEHNIFLYYWLVNSYQHCLHICPGVYWRTGFHCPGGNHHMMHRKWCHHVRPGPCEVGNEYLSGLLYEIPSSDLASVLLHTHTHTTRDFAVTIVIYVQRN